MNDNDLPKTLHPETLALHAGWRADLITGSVVPPIHQTTSYQFADSDQAAKRFSLQEAGPIYTRLGNPTIDVLEQRLAALEGGVAAVAVSSGQAASAMAVQTIAQAGDNIVSSTDIYGGTWNLFTHTLRNMGIDVRFVDPSDPQAFLKASDERTRGWYLEMLPNPKLVVPPLAEIASLGRTHNIPLIVDNTAAPLIAKPLEHGAAIVIYSTTKYIGGHGTSIGGIIIDSGTFDWDKTPKRHPLLTTPDPSYHGLIWSEAAKKFGPIAYALRLRAVLLRDLGAALSPFNAFQLIQGVETLPLRMERHCENAALIAHYLKRHKAVSKVIYPALHKGETFKRAQTYFNGRYGGLVGFELSNGVEGGKRFIDSLRLLYHVANIGDARSLAIHPASTTHSQLTPTEQKAAGVSPGYVRLSVGLEHPDDIIADLEQALAQSQKA
ncbi:O-acetylhomoserine aminocarboxypropyltransferase/cysteine synthase family protein [Aristophania vespae]|uniref:O-acetylhomoserine aminocarboxypropyltransferase/cysteine synthase family protein n=1 Tax=Aristophania vespae TaxID=2697033 RepID=UPI0023511E24|nr:O-acetylhomoserine aminocarboxypropyltransferase/cysteine synthase family protein [Aristophania vespae]UMM64346.1 O-acetyl-L-homoserine sulfhydrylase [Aristophania vespae]